MARSGRLYSHRNLIRHLPDVTHCSPREGVLLPESRGGSFSLTEKRKNIVKCYHPAPQQIVHRGEGGLEILPDGRFVGTRAGGSGQLYTIDPRSGAVTLVSLSAGGPQTGSLNGLTFADPTIPFDRFKVTLAWIKVTNRYESRDRIHVWGRFHAPDGIDPVAEAVTIGFGGDEGFNLTIPAGSFERTGRRKRFWWWSQGKWEYRAPHGTSGIRKMQIWDDGRFWLSAERLDLGGVDLHEPVDFTIWLGNNTGGLAMPFNHRGFYFNHH